MCKEIEMKYKERDFTLELKEQLEEFLVEV
ncbi:hypothetical protein ABH957_000481 [Bacillus sp. RC242]